MDIKPASDLQPTEKEKDNFILVFPDKVKNVIKVYSMSLVQFLIKINIRLIIKFVCTPFFYFCALLLMNGVIVVEFTYIFLTIVNTILLM